LILHSEGIGTIDTSAPAILVVDDDADTCRNLADILTDLGYAVDTAEGGEVALEKARRQPYHVGLLDLRMPGMDGLTLCRHLKQLQPSLVAMMITCYGGNDLDGRASSVGVWRVLPKPIDVARLLTWIEEALQDQIVQGRSEAC
jgi:CheY-like chemotaxis protein